MPKDNRKILCAVRGTGVVYLDGMEDELAAATSQERLSELVAQGFLKGDWQSTKNAILGALNQQNTSPEGQIQMQSIESRRAATTAKADKEFQPLSFEETMRRFQEFDFADEVMRSLPFYRDEIKNRAGVYSGTDETNGNGNPIGNTSENSGQNSNDDADEFAANFPARSKFMKLGKTLAEVKAMTREQLIDLDGIADKTADEVIAYFQAQETVNA